MCVETMGQILGHVCSFSLPSRPSGEPHDDSGSCRAVCTGDARKRWRKRCLRGVTRYDLRLGMSPQKGVCSGTALSIRLGLVRVSASALQGVPCPSSSLTTKGPQCSQPERARRRPWGILLAYRSRLARHADQRPPSGSLRRQGIVRR